MDDLSYHDNIVAYDDISEEKKNIIQQWDNLTMHLTDIATKKKIPGKLTLELTPECNLYCKMCYVRLDKSEMKNIGQLLTADEWIKITRDAVNLGSLFIMITGGEPLLHPEFEKIYTEISKMGCRICLLTNGVHVTDKVLEMLVKYPPSSMLLTLYGASEATYEKVCKNGKAFNSVINNIIRIKSALPNTPFSIRATLIKDNVDDVNDMIEIVKKFDTTLSLCTTILRPVRGAVRPELVDSRLTQKEIRSIMYKYLYYDKVSNEDEIGKIRTDKNYNCNAGVGACVVTWDGKMIPCVLYSSPYTEPMKDGFSVAWEKLKDLKKEMTIPQRCVNCKNSDFCGSCPAYIQAESGTYKDNESYLCSPKY